MEGECHRRGGKDKFNQREEVHKDTITDDGDEIGYKLDTAIIEGKR